jgi:NADPH-dependent 2,4-dienoyl-CoA reductase/sulfur reductase-like enzyme
MTIMTRALICDPEMPAKTAEGRLDDIRACIGCNQACIGHFHAGYPISCVQFPETGRELLFPRSGTAGHQRHPAAALARRVLVVGGGPAGLKAAAVAAERGHEVTLVEAERWVGGQVRLAQRLPGRNEMGGAITNLEGEARRAGATIVTGVRADPAYVHASGADVVLVATGAMPYRPPLELMGSLPVLDAWDVIRGAEVPIGTVVVADWRCDWVGLGLATMLSTGGRRVILASSGYYAGQRIQQYVRDQMLIAARKARVEMRTTVRPFGADDSTVYLQDVLTGDAVVIEDAAALVLATGHVPNGGLLEELAAIAGAGGGFEVRGIGDVLAPRTIEEAVLDGLRAGVSI